MLYDKAMTDETKENRLGKTLAYSEAKRRTRAAADKLSGPDNRYLTEAERLERVEQCRSKWDDPSIPLDQRKLTQKEAAAYCGVTSTTIKRWESEGLKTFWHKNRRRYLLADLRAIMAKRAGE